MIQMNILIDKYYNKTIYILNRFSITDAPMRKFNILKVIT